MRIVIPSLFALLLVVLLGASMRAGGDIAPPVFIGATPELPQIDTSNSPQTITFTIHITDDLSGIAHASVRWVHQLGYNTNRDCGWNSESASGTNIFVPCAVTFPQYSAEGKWMVQFVRVDDRVGNKRYIYSTVPIYSDSKVVGYEYSAEATPAIRAMEITIGDPVTTTDPPLYLPSIMAN